MTVKPLPGTGGATVDSVAPAAVVGSSRRRLDAGSADAALAAAIEDWQPCGASTEVELAAMAVAYDASAFVAVLAFADSWDRCKEASWAWALNVPRGACAKAEAGAGSSDPTAAQAPQPVRESIAEMALRAFAAHGLPTLAPLISTGGDVELHCPGVAITLPYQHKCVVVHTRVCLPACTGCLPQHYR